MSYTNNNHIKPQITLKEDIINADYFFSLTVATILTDDMYEY